MKAGRQGGRQAGRQAGTQASRQASRLASKHARAHARLHAQTHTYTHARTHARTHTRTNTHTMTIYTKDKINWKISPNRPENRSSCEFGIAFHLSFINLSHPTRLRCLSYALFSL